MEQRMKLDFISDEEIEYILIRLKGGIGFPDKINQEKLKVLISQVEDKEIISTEEFLSTLEYLIGSDYDMGKGEGYDFKLNDLHKRCAEVFNIRSQRKRE